MMTWRRTWFKGLIKARIDTYTPMGDGVLAYELTVNGNIILSTGRNTYFASEEEAKDACLAYLRDSGVPNSVLVMGED